MKKTGLALLICLAIAFNSNGQTRFVLEGTIGNYPVVMILDNYGDDWHAIYFYKKVKHDIEVYGRLAGSDSIYLKKEVYDSKSNQDIVSESFNIHKTKNGYSDKWEGSWKNKKGAVLSVSLTTIDTTKYDFSNVPDFAFANSEDRLYTKARLSGVKFVKDSITHYGKYDLQWLHESETKIKSFFFIKGFSEAVSKKINSILSKKQYVSVNNSLSCTGKHEEEGDYETNITDYFISPEFISVQVDLSWYCGGAHPGTGDESFTINAKTGDEVENLDDLFWFTGRKPHTENDSNYYDYLMERAKIIVAILSKLYPEQMKKPVANDDACDYPNPSHWEFPVWFFTKKGLYVGATFPHATASCDKPDFSIIPYAVVKKYLNKEIKISLPNL